jgi:predicted dehydrogenase
VKALFAGLGSIGQRHLRNLRALRGDVEVLAYRTRRLQTVVTDQLAVAPGADPEREYGVRVFHELEAAVAERPDVVFVCNPSALHLAVALPAVEAGVHLFLEKPVSHTLDGVADLVAAVEARGVVAAVGCQLRFHPCLRRLRDLLAGGAVGRVVAARVQVGEYLPGWHPYEDYRTGYAARRDLGGGVVLTLVHELDYVYWLFGLPRRLWAVGGQLSRLELDVEDTASVLLEYERDGRPLPVHVQMDYLQRPADPHLRGGGRRRPPRARPACAEPRVVRRRRERARGAAPRPTSNATSSSSTRCPTSWPASPAARGRRCRSAMAWTGCASRSP